MSDEPLCESWALINDRRVHCDRPIGHQGAHVHVGDNMTIGWENYR